MTATPALRLDTAPLAALRIEIDQTPDEVDGLSMADAKRDALFRLGLAENSIRTLRKLSAE